MDKPCGILKFSKKSNSYYSLPNGIFLTPYHWWLDQKTKQMKFIKSVPTNYDNKILQIHIHIIDLYNF
jgi:hypothetical protein